MEEKTISLTYLRRERRKWGLSQRELAVLFGYRDPDHLSLVERGLRAPGRDLIIACHALFGLAPREMFPDHYAEAEEDILRRVYELVEALEGNASSFSTKKRVFADQVLDRAITRLHEQTIL